MKTYRQREKQGTKVSDSSKGPDEAKIKVGLSPSLVYFVTEVALYILLLSNHDDQSL